MRKSEVKEMIREIIAEEVIRNNIEEGKRKEISFKIEGKTFKKDVMNIAKQFFKYHGIRKFNDTSKKELLTQVKAGWKKGIKNIMLDIDRILNMHEMGKI